MTHMFSVDVPQPVVGVPGKAVPGERRSVLQRIRDAEREPKPPRKEKATASANAGTARNYSKRRD